MANNNVIAGDKEPVKIELEIERGIGIAPRVVQVYRGERSQMESAFAKLATNANRANLRTSGSTATIEITSQTLSGEIGYNPDDPRVEELSRRTNQTQISIWDSPYFSTLVAGDIANIESTAFAILDVKTSGTAGASERAQLRTDLLNHYGTLFAPDVVQIIANGLDFILGKVQNPIVFLPVLVYRRIFVNESSIQLSASTEGTVFKTNDLPIPAALLGRIDLPQVTNTLALRAGHGFAWLKEVSSSITSDGGVELIETYTYGSYPVPFYSGTWDSQA